MADLAGASQSPPHPQSASPIRASTIRGADHPAPPLAAGIPLPGVRRLLRHGIGSGEQSPEPYPKNEPG